MAETRLDARKAFLKRFVYLLVNWYVYSFTTLSILRDNLYKNGPLYIYTSAKVRNDPLATTLASLESLFVPVSREHHCTGMHLTTMPFLVDVFYMLRISNMKDCGTGLRHRVRVAQQGNQEYAVFLHVSFHHRSWGLRSWSRSKSWFLRASKARLTNYNLLRQVPLMIIAQMKVRRKKIWCRRELYRFL